MYQLAVAPTIAEWIYAGAAVVAVAGAAITILDNRRAARRRTAYEYIRRLESPSLIQHQALMSAFFRGALRPPSITPEVWEAMSDEQRRNTVPEMWRYLSESSDPSDRERLLSIIVTPNMLEGLAGMYNRGLLDRGIVKTALESEARDLWEAASKWLAVVRPEIESNTFRDLEVMIEDLAKRKRPPWHFRERSN